METVVWKQRDGAVGLLAVATWMDMNLFLRTRVEVALWCGEVSKVLWDDDGKVDLHADVSWAVERGKAHAGMRYGPGMS